MPEPLLYLKAMGFAVIVSATFVLAMAGLRRPASVTRLNSAAAVGIGLGLLAGFYLLSLGLAWPPANGLDRLFLIVIPLALGIETLAGLHSVPSPLAWVLRLSLAAAIPRILLHASVYLDASNGEWTLRQAGSVWALSGGLLAGVWGLLAWLAHRRPGISIPMTLGLASQCAGMTVMLMGYIKGGAAALPLAATLISTSLAARLVSRRTGVSATAEQKVRFGTAAILGVGVVGLFGLLFIGRFFGRVTTSDALTIFIAPLLCWVTEMPGLRHRKAWLVGTVRLVVVAIPLLFVLAMAKRDFDRDMGPLLGQVQAIGWPARSTLASQSGDVPSGVDRARQSD